MKEIPYSPFADYSVANFSQYQKNPMLMFGKLEILRDLIQQQVGQIQRGYFIGDRSIILGVRGLGKTTALYFVKETLEANDIQVVTLSRLFTNEEHFMSLNGGKSISDLIIRGKEKRPLYILVDFPDMKDVKQGKLEKFLAYLWSLISDEEIYNYVSLIFAMNESHYDKSFKYSEILGKFLTLRLEHYTYDQTEELLASRMKIIDKNIEEIFNRSSIEVIHSYSKGIPRNILTAANLLVAHAKDLPIKEGLTSDILSQKFVDRLISDRVENEELRNKYLAIVKVLRELTDPPQELFLRKLSEYKIASRTTALKHLDKLVAIGAIKFTRGGYNQVQKTWSLC